MWETAKIQHFCLSLPPSLKPSQATPAHSDCFIFWALICLYTIHWEVHCSAWIVWCCYLTTHWNTLESWACSSIVAVLPQSLPLPTCLMFAEWIMLSGQVDLKLLKDRVQLCYISASSAVLRVLGFLAHGPLSTHNDLEQSSWEPGQLPSAGLEKTLKLSWPFSSLLKILLH